MFLFHLLYKLLLSLGTYHTNIVNNCIILRFTGADTVITAIQLLQCCVFVTVMKVNNNYPVNQTQLASDVIVHCKKKQRQYGLPPINDHLNIMES